MHKLSTSLMYMQTKKQKKEVICIKLSHVIFTTYIYVVMDTEILFKMQTTCQLILKWKSS